MVLSMTLNCSFLHNYLTFKWTTNLLPATAGMVSIAAILGAPITVVATGAALIGYYALTDKSSKNTSKK